MTEKQALLGPLKALGGKAVAVGRSLANTVLGKNIPDWAYPATALAAVSPLIGYEFQRRTDERKRRAALVKDVLLRNDMPPAEGMEALRRNPYLVQMLAGKLAQDESHMDKAAEAIEARLSEDKLAGLDQINKLMHDAKTRAAKRKGIVSLDVRSEQGKLGQRGKTARGISAGAGFGNGGGYGK